MEILSGLILATVYVATPGPVSIETLHRGMLAGFLPALAVQGGSTLGRIFYASLAFLGTERLLQHVASQPLAALLGMVLLIYAGLMAIRRGGHFADDKYHAPLPHTTTVASKRSALSAGATLSLANPLNILFWLSMSGAPLRLRPAEGIPFLCAFAVGCLLASILIALFASSWHSRFSPRYARAFSWVCGLLLITFGLQIGLRAAPEYQPLIEQGYFRQHLVSAPQSSEKGATDEARENNGNAEEPQAQVLSKNYVSLPSFIGQDLYLALETTLQGGK